MSLKDIQFKRIINKVLLEELQAGVVPTKDQLKTLVAEEFKDRHPGLPSLNVREVKARSTSNSEEYNQMLNEIEDDLDVLYTSLIDQNKNIIDDFTLFENQRLNILNQINKLSKRQHEILTKSANTNPYAFSVTENFSTMKNINMNESDINVDLDMKQATTNLYKNGMYKVPLASASISLDSVEPTSEIESKEELNRLRNCLNDKLNSAWSYRVKKNAASSESEVNNRSVSLEVTITLEEKVEASQIELTPNSAGATNLEIKLDSGSGWKELKMKGQSKTLLDQKKYNFTPQEVKRVKVVLTKNTPDLEDGLTYIFGLKNISLLRTKYKSKGFLKTTPYSVNPENSIKNYTVDTIELETDDYLPASSNIDYFIKLDNGSGTFDNRLAISPLNRDKPDYDQQIRLSNATTVVNNFQTGDISRTPDYDSYGMQFFNYFNLSNNAIHKNIELYKGVDLWEFEAFQKRYINDHEVSIKDWNDPFVVNDKVYTGYVDSINSSIKEQLYSDGSKTRFNLTCRRIMKDDNGIPIFKVVTRTEDNTSETVISDTEYTLDEDQGVITFDSPPSDNIRVFAVYKARDVNYKYKTWIYCPETTTYRTSPIEYSDYWKDKAGTNKALYINNSKLQKRPISYSEAANSAYNGIDTGNYDNYYTYKINLQEGWNKVTFLTYLRSPGRNYNLGLDIDFNDINHKLVRAKREPLNQVSLYELRHTTAKDEINNFAVDSNDNLIFNHKQENNYLINYKYKVDEIERVILEAELENNDPDLTAKINSFKLNFAY